MPNTEQDQPDDPFNIAEIDALLHKQRAIIQRLFDTSSDAMISSGSPLCMNDADEYATLLKGADKIYEATLMMLDHHTDIIKSNRATLINAIVAVADLRGDGPAWLGAKRQQQNIRSKNLTIVG